MTLLPGETRTFEIAAEDAYGARDDEKLQKFPVSPEELASLRESVTPGQVVQLPNGAKAVCIAMEEDGIVLDGNHPLAGRGLTFEVELVKAGGSWRTIE